MIDYQTKEPAGTIIIDTPNTYLYLVLGNGKAMRYGIGVGREGLHLVRRRESVEDGAVAGLASAGRNDRPPALSARFMAGGEGNPLAPVRCTWARHFNRIHGTNQPSTIGTFVSSGCIRLTNEDITDLYARSRSEPGSWCLRATRPDSIQATTNGRPIDSGTPPRQRAKAATAVKPAAAAAPNGTRRKGSSQQASPHKPRRHKPRHHKPRRRKPRRRKPRRHKPRHHKLRHRKPHRRAGAGRDDQRRGREQGHHERDRGAAA